MFPVNEDVYINKPLLFINSYNFQWPENVAKMMKFVTPTNKLG